jgi:hypothetical protein
MKLRKYLMITGLVLAAFPLIADETTGEKIQNEAGEANKNLKKEGRHLKKKIRDRTGHHSMGKDIKDSSKNAADEAEHQAKKLKRKVD